MFSSDRSHTVPSPSAPAAGMRERDFVYAEFSSEAIMRFQKRSAELFTLIAFGCLLAWPSGARAQTCSSETVSDGCIQDRWIAAGGQGGDLECTANDISITKITSAVLQTCTPDDQITFTGTLTVNSNATGRYDVGAYIAEDGQPLTVSGPHKTLNGSCSVTTVPCSSASGIFSNLDSDGCGDVNKGDANNPASETFPLSGPIMITCEPCPSDPKQACVSTCTSWKQTADPADCTGPVTPTNEGAMPGTSSKCDCSVVPVVGITIVTPTPGTSRRVVIAAGAGLFSTSSRVMVVSFHGVTAP